ncbi:O-antigen polymerase [Rubrivirga sp. IMCC45206]|uniref:O-antigen polymerase n=1 Tax=Rubrivirga sp. IMCC45206 TaxID=3391614 RepID=UPI00398FCC3C
MANPLALYPAAGAAELARSNRTTRGLVLLFGFAGVALALVYAAVAWATWGFEYGLLNVVTAAALAVLLGVVVLKKDYDLTEPLSLVMLAVGVGTTLKPAYVLFGPREAWPYLLLDRPDPLFLLTPALIVAIAMTMLAVGYVAFNPRSLMGRVAILRPRAWNGRRLAVVAVAAFSLSLVAMALYIEKLGIVNILDNISGKRSFEGEGYSTSLGYYRWVASLTQPALLVSLAWALHRFRRIPTPIAMALAALAFTAIVFPFFNSSRTGIVTILLQSFIVWRCVRGRLPKGVVLSFSLAVLAILLIVTALRPKRTTTADLDVTEAIGLDLAIELTVGGRHFLDLTRTSHVIAGVPDKLRYQYGQTYFTWVTTPIPRSMWPEKPTLGSGPIIGPRIFGTSGSGVPPGLVGELYLNFGYIGIVFGAFVMGALLRFVHEQFRPYLPTPAGAVLYACVAIPLGWNAVTGDFSRMVVAALTDIVPVLVAIGFVATGAVARRRSRAAPRPR